MAWFLVAGAVCVGLAKYAAYKFSVDLSPNPPCVKNDHEPKQYGQPVTNPNIVSLSIKCNNTDKNSITETLQKLNCKVTSFFGAGTLGACDGQSYVYVDANANIDLNCIRQIPWVLTIENLSIGTLAKS